jgi:FKBP-type peptidyl-prolyl cis-trans isomerase 2
MFRWIITSYLYVIINVRKGSELMKKILIFLLMAMILFSGCVGEKTVKNGDNISVDYTGSLLNGKVFDTSIEKVAIANNLSVEGRVYKPLEFTVGKGQMIKGFDEGVIGMKVGETRILTIPPEKAYGPSDPGMIRSMPILDEVPATTEMPATRVITKAFEVPKSQFESIIGPGHKTGDIVRIPETNINLTINNITDKVSLSYNLKKGDEILWSSNAPWNETVVEVDDKNITLRAKVNKNDIVRLQGVPWNETVIKIDDKNITLKANVNKDDIIQIEGAPWNTTVVGLDNVNVTLRHNPIPETVIPSMFGQMKISFNETSIIMDQNPELAGETLIFNVTLVSIDK